MSFGLSVSDVYLVVKLANKTRKAFIDAPLQFRAISDEYADHQSWLVCLDSLENRVKTLSHLLQDLEDVIPARNLSVALRKTLEEHLTTCGKLLNDLNSALEKYHGLGPAGSRARKIWHRLKWEPDDIRDLRLRLSSNIALLNGMNDLLNRHSVSEIQDGIDVLKRFHDDEEFLKITSWLSGMDIAAQHNDLVARRQSKTGLWFLGSPEYLGWLDSSEATLYCPGIPGGGKTMIVASVIEDLWTKFGADPEVGISFIYCSYKRQHQQSLEDCLAGILKQLLQKLGKLPQSIQNLYARHKTRMTRPSIDELTSLLQSVIISYRKVYLIIDALDEYSQVPGAIAHLLQKIFQLQTSNAINFFATSRTNVPGIKQFFGEKPEVEISAKEEDVRQVLESEMSRMPACITKSPDLQILVKDEIVKAIDGMFLLTRLHLNSLHDKLRRKDVVQALTNLPRGKKALAAAYAEAIERIDRQLPGCRELAKQVLAWISHSLRPLTTMELRHALAIEHDGAGIDQDSLPEVEDIVSYCEGLVVVDEKSYTIRLVHYTTQEYLERVSQTWMQSSHKNIALACLAYLSFDEFSTGSCRNDKEFEDRLQRNVLLDYCAKHWGDHVRDADDEDVDDTAFRFLTADLKIKSVVQVSMVTSYRFSGYSTHVPFRMEALHLAAQFGLGKIMTRLLANGRNPHIKDEFGRTPLSYTAEYGRLRIVELLTLRQDVELQSTDQDGRTPLSWAAGSGHISVVESLLSCPGVDVNFKDFHMLSPLSWAARGNRVGVAKYLLTRNDTERDSPDKNGQTPLSWAAYNGHLEIVKLLVPYPNIHIDSKDHWGQTPLSWAARNGHFGVVSFLVNKPGVNMDSKDDENRTALTWASIHGHLEIVKLLASRPEVNCDTIDQQGQSPLSWAAREGYLDVVEFLMTRNDVQLQSKDRQGLTPLRWAAWNGYEDIVEILAARKAARPKQPL